MTRSSIGTRTFVRLGIAAVIASVLVLASLVPAEAGASPSISSFSPTSGPIGTSVTINGSNFTGTTSVKFNGATAPGFVVNGSGTQITVNVPGSATTGPISVTTSSGTGISGSNFSVTSLAPSITSFSPTFGPVGTIVAINGTNFGGTTVVKFHNTQASGFVVNGSGTQITVSVPSGATTGTIIVKNPSGTATSASSFTVTSVGAPVISSFSPASGPVGTLVTINGSHFTGTTSVKFHGVSSTFTFRSDAQITATVPSGATTGSIAVTNAGGTGTSATVFTVKAITVPVITSVHPNSANVGASVSIIGSGFTGTTAVKFNGTSVTAFTVVSDGKIDTTVPNGATTGRVTVTNPAGTATSPLVFTVTGPKITSFSPTTGQVGTVVTINGSRFTGTVSVKFNGTAATFTFVSDIKLTAVVPAGATTGHITVSTASTSATSTGVFTVIGAHPRTITLSLRHRRLFASGRVTVTDGYGACQRFVPVAIKRLVLGQWKWVVTFSTRQDGTFSGPLPDRGGHYRAKARRITLSNGAICGGSRSNIVHIH